MVNRESKFPSASRHTYTGRGSGGYGARRRGPLFPVLFILLLAAGYYIYEMPSRPWEPYLKQLQGFLSDRDSNKEADLTPRSSKREGVKKSVPENKAKRAKSQPQVIFSEPKSSNKGSSQTQPVQLDISIGMGFRPVGFRIAAVSQAIELSQKPHKRMRRLPRVLSQQQRYGVIKLANGQEYGFVLDLAASGYLMHLDRNRNGDLRDDGTPLVNEGKGLFASKLKLPLDVVTGIPGLKGDYQLWVFTNPGHWKRGQMRYYSMTQMRGEMLLKGTRYTVFLADNGPVDGDYRNDGINIDLDNNGKIDRRTEFFPRGKPIFINGVQYIFRITR